LFNFFSLTNDLLSVLLQKNFFSLQVPPNYSKNDFESVRSVLTWNLENWPQGRLNRYEDNANYSCRSSANSVGSGVHSATHFRVEYPPDSLYVSQEVVNVVEHDTPERVLCSAQAYPEATYIWRFNDQVIQTHNVLYFNGPVSRDQAGVYVCEAQNRHGTAFVTARLNVMYRPECRISQEKGGDGDGGDQEVGMEGGVRLVCTAEANPSEVSFQWRRGNGSAAVDFDGEAVTFSKGRQQSSMLVISVEQQQVEGGGGFGTFHCYVNNSLGLGVPCEMDVQGLPVGLVRNVSNTNIIVIVAVIAAGLVAAALVATTVIVCRRWRVPEEKQKKCANNSEDRDRNENEVSGISSGPGVAATVGSQQPPQPIHKWPLRPGVHVHVNGLNTLTGGPAAGLQATTAAANSKLNHQINGFSYGATKSSRSSSSSGSDWASNASSNPELSSTAELDPLKRQQQLAGRLSAGKSATGVLATHPELPGDTATASSSASSSSTASTGVEAAKELSATTGSRPGSRLRKSRREAAQSANNSSGGSQPSYYENVSYNPNSKQKQLDLLMLQRRSESPNTVGGHQSEEEGGGGGGLRSRHSSGCNLRPVSQLSGHGNGSLYAFGSNRSSRAGSVPRAGGGGMAAPSPACSLHPAYRASLGRTTNHRAYGEQQVHDHHHDHHHHHQHGRHRTLYHSNGYAGRPEAGGGGEPLQLTPEAEVETDSDLSQERNLLIEYTTHVPYSAYASHDTPILSSLLHSQSLAKSAALGRYGGVGGGPLDYGGGGPSLLLLTEPISPPKQFDTSPRTSARESTY
jgi:hypothetical protein